MPTERLYFADAYLREAPAHPDDLPAVDASFEALIADPQIEAVVTALVLSGDRICEPDVKWPVLREYQKHRVCTLLDPTKDPLGKGFHTLQAMIAIGSGGVFGKGLMAGVQKLFYVPEPHTDFIFAVTAESTGFVGSLLLFSAISLWLLIVLDMTAKPLIWPTLAPEVSTSMMSRSIISWPRRLTRSASSMMFRARSRTSPEASGWREMIASWLAGKLAASPHWVSRVAVRSTGSRSRWRISKLTFPRGTTKVSG